MGLLIFVRSLLLTLCLFLVLGFLYYSVWKLHLLQWEDSNWLENLGHLASVSSSIESVKPFNHLILCRPLLLLPSIFPIHHEKCWAGRNTSWNQDCWEKYQ
ncbi:hypothetical protein FD755_015988 [Muntiacus reevesi]|uniref:Uncharacterized protein n=1 Tax=Muntiacus reevesi TaxID=9886 RepID=A0A5N3XG40_MUNRE|nr:hypothetical protein FD755_015988 [Muntiacus reevesi]